MSDAWRAVDGILAHAASARITPGASLCAARRDGNEWRFIARTAGTLAWDDPRPVGEASLYDLASVTKPFTAWAAARLAARGEVDLHAPLSALLPAATGAPVAHLTLDAMLSHRAGLAPWRPLFQTTSPQHAGREETRGRVLHEALHEVPSPDGRAVYSDLGYILAGACLSSVTGLALDALLARECLGDELGFGPVAPGDCAPTERCAWRGGVVRGEVHDENAFALGGIAGHAGLFGTARALCERGVAMLDALRDDAPWARAMLAPRDGGTHRLGWDTRSPRGSSAGTKMGPRTFGHLGFTGTSLWCDPDAEVVIALLTNRVHPTREGDGIRALRPAVHDAVMRALR